LIVKSIKFLVGDDAIEYALSTKPSSNFPDAKGLLRNARIVTDCPTLKLNLWDPELGEKEYVYVSGVSLTLSTICHS